MFDAFVLRLQRGAPNLPHQPANRDQPRITILSSSCCFLLRMSRIDLLGLSLDWRASKTTLKKRSLNKTASNFKNNNNTNDKNIQEHKKHLPHPTHSGRHGRRPELETSGGRAVFGIEPPGRGLPKLPVTKTGELRSLQSPIRASFLFLFLRAPLLVGFGTET